MVKMGEFVKAHLYSSEHTGQKKERNPVMCFLLTLFCLFFAVKVSRFVLLHSNVFFVQYPSWRAVSFHGNYKKFHKHWYPYYLGKHVIVVQRFLCKYKTALRVVIHWIFFLWAQHGNLGYMHENSVPFHCWFAFLSLNQLSSSWSLCVVWCILHGPVHSPCKKVHRSM